jgi:hypothetical protein
MYSPPAAAALAASAASPALLPFLSTEHCVNIKAMTSLPQVAAHAASKHVAQQVTFL